MKRIIIKFSTICTLFLFYTASISAEPNNPDFHPISKHVVIISIDGARPELISTKKLLNIESTRARGLYSYKARAIFPSITSANHASMLSGVGPVKHKTYGNINGPPYPIITVPTIFELAKKNSLTTAFFVGKAKLLHLNRPGTIDYLYAADTSATKVARKAMETIIAHKPNLIFIHLPDPDLIGHRFGWLSKQQKDSVKNCDYAIGLILFSLKKAGIQNETTIIITADHGGHDNTHGTKSDLDMFIPWIIAGKGIVNRGEIKVPITTYDTAATAAMLLGLKVPKEWNWDGKSVLDKINNTMKK